MPLEARSQVLQTRCNQILEAIYRPDPAFPIDNDEMEVLKQEYNQLSHKIESLKCGYLRDPLISLPPELWTDVILEATRENGANLPSTDALLLLTLVSHEWGKKILHTPRFWTKITIGRGETDAQAKLATALHLSGNLRFQLTIDILPFQWPDDVLRLQPYASRINDIVLRKSQRRNYDPRQATEFFDQLLRSLDRLPSLQILQCMISPPLNWSDIFARSPNLSYIYGHEVPFKILKTQTEIPFRACELNSLSSAVIQCLEDKQAVSLEEITWYLYDDANIRTKTLPSLPGLKRIYSYGASNADLFALLRMTEHLTTLQLAIHDGWQDIHLLFNLLEYLPQLVVLHLTLSVISGKLIFSSTKLTKTRVQDLQVDLEYDIDEPEIRGSDFRINSEAPFSVLPVYFADVKRLVVKFLHFGPSVAAYIASIPRLWYLCLENVTLEPNSGALIESSSIEVLRLENIRGIVLQSLLTTLRCPWISRLELDQKHFYFPNDSHHWDDLSVYNTVETLHTGDWRYEWIVPRFDALKRLRIRAFDDDSESAFLIRFIMEPEICPELIEVEIAFIPEWDLLFLMLERRNYLPPSRGVARIKTLSLPSPIPLTLLTPLADILSGRFTWRLSNMDLSFSRFMQAYFDPNISGCRRCIRSMMSCTTAPRLYHRDPTLYHKTALPGYLPTVPLELWNWLQKREDRLNDWKAHRETWVKGGLVRYAVCIAVQMAQRPFIITCRSFSDLPGSQ